MMWKINLSKQADKFIKKKKIRIRNFSSKERK